MSASGGVLHYKLSSREEEEDEFLDELLDAARNHHVSRTPIKAPSRQQPTRDPDDTMDGNQEDDELGIPSCKVDIVEEPEGGWPDINDGKLE